jgi:hypothetical protein
LRSTELGDYRRTARALADEGQFDRAKVALAIKNTASIQASLTR